MHGSRMMLDRIVQRYERHLDEMRMARARRRVAHHASDIVQPWDWQATRYNRVALVNHLLGRFSDPAYLEIGCDCNDLFDAVPCRDKTGVDPVAGGTHRMTSDAFFAGNQQRFDVIFVDGLHVYEQVRRDVGHALSSLTDRGWIVIHDMLPRTWLEEHVPRVQHEWTGDVWKVAAELAASPQIDFAIAAIDHGIGLARRRTPQAMLADMRDALGDARFDDFCRILPSLPVLDWNETIAWLERGRAQ